MSKTVGVFVDVSNIYYCVSKGFPENKVDYQKYLEKATNDLIIYRATAFGVQNNPESAKFISCLKHLGYDTKFKKFDPKSIMVDYPDEFIRKMRITGLFSLRGGGRFLDINKNEIEKIDTEYELLCSVTKDFFKENSAFLKTIVKSVKKPILLAIYENITCKDGVKIDIEYKVFDNLKLPEDIATLLIDDGSTAFSLDLKFKTKNGVKKPVSILHVAFPSSSLERSAYFLIDRAIKRETAVGFRQLPFWATPIQIRIIAYDQSCLKDAIKLAEELNLLNFRVDLDDRKINYDIKKKAKDLKWIPYIVTVDKNNKALQRLIVENKTKGTVKKNIRKENLIEEIKTEDGVNIIVPRYLPMLLSKRVILGSRRT